jgi:hypothetical protein
MKASTKRLILRVVHLVSVIPVLGYVYQPVAEAAEYQRFTQMVFIPLAVLTGYWMYLGFVWAVVGAASWVTLNYFFGPQTGFGIAVIVQIAIFLARKIWLSTRKRSVTPEVRTA